MITGSSHQLLLYIIIKTTLMTKIWLITYLSVSVNMIPLLENGKKASKCALETDNEACSDHAFIENHKLNTPIPRLSVKKNYSTGRLLTVF